MRGLARHVRGATRLSRLSLIAHSVTVSIILIAVTAIAVGVVTLQLVDRQVVRATDQHLADAVRSFGADLENRHEDLLAVASWLGQDPEFLTAVRERRLDVVTAQLDHSVHLLAVDEALVADPSGNVVAARTTDASPTAPPTPIGGPGFAEALAGRQAYGISRAPAGYLRQELYYPLGPETGGSPTAVLRVSAFLNEKSLAQFKAQTGLDVSLFVGEERVVTTLRQPDGSPLISIGPDPAIYQQVVGQDVEVFAWRDLPIGRYRASYLPLTGTGDDRIGMLSLATPATTIDLQWREAALPALGVLSMVFAAGAVLASVLANRVRGPVMRLSEAATRLQGGDLATQVPTVELRELAPLAEQLERARMALRAHLDAAENQTARQRALFAAVRQPILVATPEGEIASVNPAAVRLFGDSARLIGQSVYRLLPFVSSGTAAEETGAGWQGRVADVTGQTVDVEVDRVVLREGPLPASHVYVLHDVSHYAELSRLREELLYAVAHELRGPLAVLDNALEILATEYEELSVREFERIAGSARRTGRRLHGLMEDLLNAGSIQSGRFQVRPRRTPLSSLVDEARELVEPMLEVRRQSLDCSGFDDLAVRADRRYARQVLANLIQNASKYSPEGEPIEIRAVASGDSVRVSVVDRGPGISSAQQAGLFERFYRLKATGEKPGIGLGLAVAKGIVEAHGGEIGIESGVGKGTTIWFTLPAAREGEE